MRFNFRRIPCALGRTQRDAQGNPTQETSLDSGSQTTQYDPLGLPRQVTDALGRTTTYERDLLGRPTHITHPDGTTTTLRYDQDAVGYLGSVTDPSGTTSIERDSLGRTTRKTQTLSNGHTRSIAYQQNIGVQNIGVRSCLLPPLRTNSPSIKLGGVFEYGKTLAHRVPRRCVSRHFSGRPARAHRTGRRGSRRPVGRFGPSAASV